MSTDATTPEQPRRCPDCGGRMLDALTDRAFCAYKRTSGYGPCGVPRERPTLREAAQAVLDAAGGDYDGRNVLIPLQDSLGARLRHWDDLHLAIEAQARPAVASEGLRAAVAEFAAAMEERLAANDHKGHWDDCESEWLLWRRQFLPGSFDTTTPDDSVSSRYDQAHAIGFREGFRQAIAAGRKPATYESLSCDDESCQAVNSPTTAAEYQVAYEHWRWHGYLNGCSHGS